MRHSHKNRPFLVYFKAPGLGVNKTILRIMEEVRGNYSRKRKNEVKKDGYLQAKQLC